MARKLRLEYSGACYHVINRGNYQRPLFAQPDAAEAFYRCLNEACDSFGWLVHAFAILDNHFHMAVETPEPNLSEGMKWLQGTWAQRFNRFRGLVGRPFQGRYKAKHVEPGHALAQVAHYIHLNPVRARIVTAERVGGYRWSSLWWFCRKPRPGWLVASTVLSESGGLADTPAGWRSYRGYLAALAESEPKLRDRKFTSLIPGWAVGSTAFRAEIRTRLRQPQDRAGRFDLLGAERQAVLQARAELWEDQLRRLAEAFQINLSSLPATKSALEKLKLAAALKRTTSVSKQWLAQRLQMGAASSLGPLLHRFRASGAAEDQGFKAILSQFLT